MQDTVSLPPSFLTDWCHALLNLICGSRIAHTERDASTLRCERCSAGQFKPSPGDEPCSACHAGKYQEAMGGSACRNCEIGRYQPYKGAAECLQCVAPLSAVVGSPVCSVCGATWYQVTTSTPPSALNCQPCPSAFDCGVNTTLSTVMVRPGYWRLSASAQTAYRCRGDERGPCTGGREVGQLGDGYCNGNSSGPLCEVCAHGSYFNKGTSTCLWCPEESLRSGLLLGAVAGVLLILGAVSRIAGKPPAACRSQVLYLNIAVQRVGMAGFREVVKITFTFYQLVSYIPALYEVDLPESFNRPWEVARNIMAVVSEQQIYPCLSFYGALALKGIGGLLLAAVVFVIGTVFAWYRSTRRLALRECMLAGGLPATLPVIYICTPAVSVMLFSTWNCVPYDFDLQAKGAASNSAELSYGRGVTRSFLRDSPAIECGDSEHSKIIRLAVILIFIWPIGATAAFSWLLVKCRNAIQTHTPTKLSRACAFLHKEIKPKSYYFEVILLGERILLSGPLLLIPQGQSFLRLLCAVLITTFGAVFVPLIRAYKQVVHDYLSIASHIVLQVIFISASYIRLHNDISELSGEEAADNILRMNTMQLGLVMLGVCAIMLSLVITMLVTQLRADQHLQILRGKDGSSPTLSLGDGRIWHLFNSHVWVTGQVQAALLISAPI